ncbi:MAG TPA: CPBP family intramembrane glutamic endopeptidase [Actinomycetota bacterium]|nr:CPBP family intramembrane glutamic endopeptidase [Actinomycetota bacterium]
MVVVALVTGILAQAGGWWLVERGHGTVWSLVTPLLLLLGVVAVVIGVPPLSVETSVAGALGIGAAAGVGFYVATRAFVIVVTGWETFRRRSAQMYARQDPLSTSRAVLLSAVLGAPGEELFWRGLLQAELARALDGRTALAAAIALVLFVAANAPSGNLAIVAAALVGGAVWGSLAAWTGGVAAPIVCHALWTALMIAFPVVRRPADIAT